MSPGVDQRCSELFPLTCGLNLLRQLLCLRSLKANGDQIRNALQYWLAHRDSAQRHAGDRLRTTTDSDDYIASLILWRVSNHGRCTQKRVGNALRSLNPDTVKILRMPLIEHRCCEVKGLCKLLDQLLSERYALFDQQHGPA